VFMLGTFSSPCEPQGRDLSGHADMMSFSLLLEQGTFLSSGRSRLGKETRIEAAVLSTAGRTHRVFSKLVPDPGRACGRHNASVGVICTVLRASVSSS
jgi:hypothetical protein